MALEIDDPIKILGLLMAAGMLVLVLLEAYKSDRDDDGGSNG